MPLCSDSYFAMQHMQTGESDRLFSVFSGILPAHQNKNHIIIGPDRPQAVLILTNISIGES
jgi:hypothetical protein